MIKDIRYAVRTLSRSAGLTFVIVASLAIGIGANTAIFSVVNALLLKPLPYPESGRLAVLWLRSTDLATFAAVSMILDRNGDDRQLHSRPSRDARRSSRRLA